MDNNNNEGCPIKEQTPLEASFTSQESALIDLRSSVTELGLRLTTIRTSTPRTIAETAGIQDNRNITGIKEKINLNTNQIGHIIKEIKEIISELDI